MLPKKKPHFTLPHLGFDELVAKTPQMIYNELLAFFRSSRKLVFPKSVEWNSFAVIVKPECITVNLVRDGEDVAYFSFVPGPFEN
jgi:hypothetical protein